MEMITKRTFSRQKSDIGVLKIRVTINGYATSIEREIKSQSSIYILSNVIGCRLDYVTLALVHKTCKKN